jgi:hypothetical protein
VLRQRFAGAGTECLVGRDLDCDIVLDDEHSAPRHARLTLLEDGRVRVQDLGTRNGTRVDGRRIPADDGVVLERGEIIVGRTRLHIRTRHAPNGPERVFRREFLRRHRTLLAVAGVSACVACGGFLRWLEAPSSLLVEATTAALVVLAAIALWAGLWALTTKLNHGSWHLRIHVAIVSIAAALCAAGYWLAGLVAFATQWAVLARFGIAVVGGTALFAIYLHLREATPYGRRMSLALAATATALIGAIAWVVAIALEDGSVNRVDLGPDVRLGAARVVPNRDLADYLAEVEELKREAARERQKSLRNAPLADAEE